MVDSMATLVAALISEKSDIYTRVCVDASGWGLCAERSAIAAMISFDEVLPGCNSRVDHGLTFLVQGRQPDHPAHPARPARPGRVLAQLATTPPGPRLLGPPADTTRPRCRNCHGQLINGGDGMSRALV